MLIYLLYQLMPYIMHIFIQIFTKLTIITINYHMDDKLKKVI
jgi:hypothetical protein